MKRLFVVSFFNGSFFCPNDEAKIEVMANDHEHAISLARRRGYKLKDGWRWSSVYPV